MVPPVADKASRGWRSGRSFARDSERKKLRAPQEGSIAESLNRNNSIYPGVAQLVARVVWDHQAAGSRPVTSTKNPSTLSADFLFKPIGLAYHHALACISLPHSCGVYHHTIGVYTSIGLMRYNGFTADDMQN